MAGSVKTDPLTGEVRMMSNNLQRKRQFHLNIDSYLKTLSMLVGRCVEQNELSSIDLMEEVRTSASRLSEKNKTTFRTRVDELNSTRFMNFVDELNKKNSSKIYIWLEKTNYCGLFKCNSLFDIKYQYVLDSVSDGVIVFLTDNLTDKLLIDFDDAHLEIEVQGENWHNVKF
ncbi:hypothetical protein FG475_15295 [Vibrio navarrensis]|nr:hypothetical protein [Vibrio navarrensis]